MSTASYPTPTYVLRVEHLNDDFLKVFLPFTERPFHYFRRARDAYAHTHPYAMISHVVVGGYVEEVYTLFLNGTWHMEVFERRPGTSHEIPASRIHRLVRLLDGPALTHVEPGENLNLPWHHYDFRADGTVWRCLSTEFGNWQPWPWKDQ